MGFSASAVSTIQNRQRGLFNPIHLYSSLFRQKETKKKAKCTEKFTILSFQFVCMFYFCVYYHYLHGEKKLTKNLLSYYLMVFISYGYIVWLCYGVYLVRLFRWTHRIPMFDSRRGLLRKLLAKLSAICWQASCYVFWLELNDHNQLWASQY